MVTETMAHTLILVVSRDLSALFPRRGDNSWQLEVVDSGWEALERVQSSNCPDIILLDLGENAADGLHTLRWLRRVRPDIPVVMLSNGDNAMQKTEALRLGARDFRLKPVREADLAAIIERNTDQPYKGSDSATSADSVEEVAEDMVFVSVSPAMRQLRAQAELLAQTDAPLLLVGQDDTGKETAARLIHKRSVRSGFKFLKINCSALSADVTENELFGLDRAVVGGGVSSKPNSAETGTLYFDEVTALPLPVQEKLIRLLQEKTYMRTGGEAKVGCDFRLIAGTQANLEEALAQGNLREDLYFRLSAFTVYVPPLKQRREDIALLLTQFMTQLARHYDLPARTFSPAVLSACRRYPWPGNLKELENFTKRYLVVGDDELALTELERKSANTSELEPDRNKLEAEAVLSKSTSEAKDTNFGLKSLVQSVKGEAERNAIAMALEQTHWNRKAASKVLQVSYRTLLYKIQQYHLSPPAAYLAPVFAGQAIKTNSNRH